MEANFSTINKNKLDYTLPSKYLQTKSLTRDSIKINPLFYVKIKN